MPSSSTRAPRRDAAQNRESILTAARAVLASNPEAPLEDIVSAAGLTRRAFYGHFASRDELRVELARSGAQRVASAVADAERDDTRITLALVGLRMWDEVGDVRLLAQTAVRGPLLGELAAPLAPVRALLLRTVERGVTAGEIRTDIEPATLARLLEASAIAVLEEAAQTGIDGEGARRLVVRSVLSISGMSWQEIESLLAQTAELREGAA
ncbi:TetR/AcrR family transcriptional regulator [Amnibacterium flavum]|uniref:TetR family transcriptional regulator n=1 Tax=Amnibacterium flavum TaxID=2173173 RepID=A0A2V1HUJ4_9MICO|nr:TetR/AcrR family transcriptional regulator [Amnibacterium flavum]PVZ95362.1 TetR family transcriptional regulator [Amnibacterium flavum]